MPLKIEPVLQPERLELIVGQLARHKATGLIPELGDPFIDQSLVDRIVNVHPALASKMGGKSW
jgi:folate-dependent phosphoribosylglycinamide formyltransferase PurN